MAKRAAQIRREVDAYLRRNAGSPTSEATNKARQSHPITRLRDQIQHLLDKWKPIVGVRVRQWRLKELDDYWASTDWARGKITFCTRLASKTPDFVEFVVVHEIIHLLRGPRGHDQHFYDLMDRYLPNWRRYKLRKPKR